MKKEEKKPAMKHILDAIVVIVLMAIIINALVSMIAPLAPFIVIGAVILLAGLHIGKRAGYF